ncbi:WYL domain-containing protein, partial [Microbacterium sp.]|uniref:WYL domain-containing protein n=1 Tax=Microbacterium sp. TaxID=51671 RepID=UPI002762E467|nr:hypothetical protein [Microbacterium sp.]
AALRLGRRATAQVQGFSVPFVDVHIFADELASYGPEVRVVEPTVLKDAVIARLEATIAAHTESASADSVSTGSVSTGSAHHDGGER